MLQSRGSQTQQHWHFEPGNSVLGATVLWFVGCLVASLASSHWMSVAPPLSFDNQKCAQILLSVLWWQNYSCLRTSGWETQAAQICPPSCARSVFISGQVSDPSGNCAAWLSVLVSSGCHNKIPETRWLTQQKFISHSLGGWEVQGQGSGKMSFLLRPLLLVAAVCLLTCPLLQALRERELPLL